MPVGQTQKKGDKNRRRQPHAYGNSHVGRTHLCGLNSHWTQNLSAPPRLPLIQLLTPMVRMPYVKVRSFNWGRG